MRYFNLINGIILGFLLLPQTGTAQSIEWQEVLGGVHSEYLYDIKATPDYGFLLIGSSFSDKSGNKEEKGQGNLDYFLWKMDDSGKMEWQKSFGGSGNDFLYSASITKEGGFILGGSSDSPKSGDKKEDGFGNMDFWILKINPEGKEEWQLTLGGIGNDQLQSIQQTPDGGYIIGGSSDSSNLDPEDNDKQLDAVKSQDSFGSMDYWILKIDANGKIEWEKTYGGQFRDELRDIVITEDGYLLGGNSNSGISGNKTVENMGQSDYWIIKIDKKGNELWQQIYGGKASENLVKMAETSKGFLLAGSSASTEAHSEGGKRTTNGNGTDFWVLEIDKNGIPLWDKTYDIGKWDVLVSATPAPSKGGESQTFLLGGYASSETLGKGKDRKGIDDYVAIKIKSGGEVLWQKSIGGSGSDRLKGITQTRDGGYILAGNSDSPKSGDKDRSNTGGSDYWVVKLGNENKMTEERSKVEIYPNPTIQYTNIVITRDFKQARAEIFDMNGRKLQSKDLPYRSTPIDLQGYAPGVYVFKIIIDGEVEDVKVLKKGSK